MTELAYIEDDELLEMKPPSFPYPGEQELIQTFFPSYLNAERLLTKKIAEWKEVSRRAREELKAEIRAIQRLPDPKARWFSTEVLKVLSEPSKRLKKARQHIARLDRLLMAAKRVFKVEDEPMGRQVWQEKVAKAREVPILSVVPESIRVRKAGKSHVARCPFHDDNDPSLHIYPDRNRWHCYGCQKGGDAIAFVMESLGCDFKHAVNHLAGGLENE